MFVGTGLGLLKSVAAGELKEPEMTKKGHLFSHRDWLRYPRARRIIQLLPLRKKIAKVARFSDERSATVVQQTKPVVYTLRSRCRDLDILEETTIIIRTVQVGQELKIRWLLSETTWPWRPTATAYPTC